MNDDILVKKTGWDIEYYNISNKISFDHLVYYKKFKNMIIT